MKRFLSRLQDKVVIGDKKDSIIWLETKDGASSIKSLHTILEHGRSISFPVRVVWNVWVPPKRVFLLMRHLGEKN